MRNHSLFLILILNFLWSCSSDDNQNMPNKPEPVGSKLGVFIDSPVQGVKYQTETHSGFTDENGNFSYEEGETVTFYVGDILIGSTFASEELSPISIASTSNATIATYEVQNIAAFLQTLDEDGNPENGIIISPDVAEAISLTEIDFTKSIIQILGEIVIEIFQNTGISLEVVYPERAALHLASSLDMEFEPVNYFSYNFLPTFTNYFGVDNHTSYSPGATVALFWVHEFDAEEKLIRSTAYEKYPFRVHSEYDFSNYDPVSLSVDLQIKTNSYYNWWEVYDPENYTIKFDQNFLIEELIPGEGAVLTKRKVIEEYNSENWVTASALYNEEGQFILRGQFTYDPVGNLLETKIIQPDGSEKLLMEYTYTDFSEVKTLIHYLNDNNTREYEYFYREDNTLEKYQKQFSTGISTSLLSEEEMLVELSVMYDNGYHLVYTYGPEESVEHEYYNGVLSYIYYYRFEDEYGYSGYPYKWDWYEDGVLRERYTLNENYQQESYEYFYDNGNVEYKDFYDDEGNSTYREYYDEEGNLVNTEYYN